MQVAKRENRVKRVSEAVLTLGYKIGTLMMGQSVPWNHKKQGTTTTTSASNRKYM